MSQTKFCPRCKTEKSIGDFYLNKGRADGLSGYCAECQRISETERRTRLRNSVIAHLGGRCTRCGFEDPRALQIDHVNGGGTEERSLYGASTAFMRRVLADTTGAYQLLCANCNCIKRIEDAEHKGKREYVRTPPTERKQPEGRWTPERRAAHAERMKELHSDPEWAARRAAAISEARRPAAAASPPAKG